MMAIYMAIYLFVSVVIVGLTVIALAHDMAKANNVTMRDIFAQQKGYAKRFCKRILKGGSR
jgi:hypothetical protein